MLPENGVQLFRKIRRTHQSVVLPRQGRPSADRAAATASSVFESTASGPITVCARSPKRLLCGGRSVTSFLQKVGIWRFQNKYSSREPSFVLPLARRGRG